MSKLEAIGCMLLSCLVFSSENDWLYPVLRRTRDIENRLASIWCCHWHFCAALSEQMMASQSIRRSLHKAVYELGCFPHRPSLVGRSDSLYLYERSYRKSVGSPEAV
eukprot:5723410-Pleurochrysis_carterae.AAC.4